MTPLGLPDTGFPRLQQQETHGVSVQGLEAVAAERSGHTFMTSCPHLRRPHLVCFLLLISINYTFPDPSLSAHLLTLIQKLGHLSNSSMVSPGGLWKSILRWLAGSRLVHLAWETPHLYSSSSPTDTPFLLAAILKNLLAHTKLLPYIE